MLNGFESITCIGNNYCLQTVHPFFVGVVVGGGGVGDGDAGTVVVPCNIDYCVEANISRFNLSPYQHTREKKRQHRNDRTKRHTRMRTQFILIRSCPLFLFFGLPSGSFRSLFGYFFILLHFLYFSRVDVVAGLVVVVIFIRLKFYLFSITRLA